LTKYGYIDEVVARRQPRDIGVGGDMEIVQNRWDTIEYYQDLYDEIPWSRQRAKAATNLLAAQAEFRDHVWSPRAIIYGFRAARQSLSLPTIGYALSTLCGRPGRDFARRIYMNFLLDDENKGKIW
jgi:hypothetical protein